MNSKDRYQQLFQESIDSIIVMDDAFQIEEANHAFKYRFGNAFAHDFQSYFSKSDQWEHFKQTLLNEKHVDEFETFFTGPDDKPLVCVINCVKIIEEEGVIFLAVIRDISRRKNAEQELLRAEKLSMTGKIARSIAHEIRNPLTNLTLALEQLKDEIPQDIDADLYFDIIGRNASRIDTLITDLLNSSKPKELKLELMSLNDVVHEAVDLVQDRINLREMELGLNLSNQLSKVALDKDQLQTAILNLLVNAIEAMRDGEGRLEISSWEDEAVHLKITDNGKGISEEHMQQLFEPFFSGKRKGTGLGLLSVQNIIHSHQAKIDVNSRLGAGTTFVISFPIPEL